MLERLGMLTRPSPTLAGQGNEKTITLRPPACAREDLKQCQEGCCWRWLVHTMLEDVDALKKSLDEATEELSQRTAARRKLEQVAEHRKQLARESISMRAAIEALREEVPRLRQEREELRREALQEEERHREMLKQHRRLPDELRLGAEQEKSLEEEVIRLEQQIEEKKDFEEATLRKIRGLRDEAVGIGPVLQAVTEERDTLRAEVEKCEGLMKAKRGARSRKKSSSPRRP